MAYKKTTWINNQTPVNADNLNNIEGGIEAADILAAAAYKEAGIALEEANKALTNGNILKFVDNLPDKSVAQISKIYVVTKQASTADVTTTKTTSLESLEEGVFTEPYSIGESFTLNCSNYKPSTISTGEILFGEVSYYKRVSLAAHEDGIPSITFNVLDNSVITLKAIANNVSTRSVRVLNMLNQEISMCTVDDNPLVKTIQLTSGGTYKLVSDGLIYVYELSVEYPETITTEYSKNYYLFDGEDFKNLSEADINTDKLLPLLNALQDDTLTVKNIRAEDTFSKQIRTGKLGFDSFIKVGEIENKIFSRISLKNIHELLDFLFNQAANYKSYTYNLGDSTLLTSSEITEETAGYTNEEIDSKFIALENIYVAKEKGKGLSENNFTSDYKEQLDNLEERLNATVILENGLIPVAVLPGFVDDVLEYQTKEDFPETGEAGKIYLDATANIGYRWSGSQYASISSSVALGETSATAYAGDKGKANAEAIAALQKSVTQNTAKFSNYLPKSGGTMTGALRMGSNAIYTDTIFMANGVQDSAKILQLGSNDTTIVGTRRGSGGAYVLLQGYSGAVYGGRARMQIYGVEEFVASLSDLEIEDASLDTMFSEVYN